MCTWRPHADIRCLHLSFWRQGLSLNPASELQGFPASATHHAGVVGVPHLAAYMRTVTKHRSPAYGAGTLLSGATPGLPRMSHVQSVKSKDAEVGFAKNSCLYSTPICKTHGTEAES